MNEYKQDTRMRGVQYGPLFSQSRIAMGNLYATI